MKNYIKSIALTAIAALAFAGCAKEVANTASEEFTHTAQVVLSKNEFRPQTESKTAVVEGQSEASYIWIDGDASRLHVYENGTEGEITKMALIDGGATATLTVSFTGTPTAPYTYTAMYATDISNAGNPLIPASQSPTTSSFDPTADILVAKPITSETETLTSLSFTMGRVVTVNKMTLTGLVAGEKISKVEFELDQYLSSRYTKDKDTGEWGFTGNNKKLTLNYDDAEVPSGGTFPVYFVAAPVTAAGIVGVVVTTDQNVYTKTDKLDPNPFAGKSLSLAVGTFMRFNMGLSGYGEAVSSGTPYSLVNDQDDLYDGATYLIAGLSSQSSTLYALGEQKTNNRAGVAVEDNNGVITIDNTIEVFPIIIESVTGGYSLKDATTNKYLYTDQTGSNRLYSQDSVDEYATWSISISNGVANIENVGNTSRGVLCFNSGWQNNTDANPIFAGYSSAPSNSTSDLALYIDPSTCIPSLATPDIEAGATGSTITVLWDDVANADGYKVTCTGQSDQNIATGVETAIFTGLADGTYTVTVTAISNDHSVRQDSQAASQQVVVGAAPGSANNPYTVAQARAAIDAGSGISGVYVKGIISAITYAYSSNNNNISFNISDDGSTTGNQLNAYKAEAASADDFAVGDGVIMTGDLTKYNSTYEIGEGGTKVELIRMPTLSGDLSFSTSTSVTMSAATGATIYYTGDDTTPTTNSSVYSSAINVTETTTFKAIAEKDGLVSGVASKTFTKGAVVDYVTLPWSYPESGDATSAGLTAITAVTASGLGSDYAESNSPYRIKLDTSGDYIQIKTDSPIDAVSVDYKMIGGGNTSTLTFKESSDGNSWSDVQALSIAGAQNSTGTVTTTNLFNNSSRYVQIVFTKGSNVGLGGIAITKASTDPVIAAADINVTALGATNAEASYSIANFVGADDVSVKSYTGCVTAATITNGTIKYSVGPNYGTTNTTGTIVLQSAEADDKTINVTQTGDTFSQDGATGNPLVLTIAADATTASFTVTSAVFSYNATATAASGKNLSISSGASGSASASAQTITISSTTAAPASGDPITLGTVDVYRNGNTSDGQKITITIVKAVSGTNSYTPYSTGFESSDGFTAGTNYQSTITDGPTGKKWKIFYGTPSTSSAITGSQSLALRLYTSNNYGYAEMQFDVPGANGVSFKAKAATSNSASIKVTIKESTDGGTTWSTVSGWSAKSLTTSANDYSFSVSGEPSQYRIRFEIDASSTKPSKSNAQLTIDDVSISVVD